MGREHKINDKLLLFQKAQDNLLHIIRNRVAIENLIEAEERGEFIGYEKIILEKLEQLEYGLQESWNFPKDKWWHLRQFGLSRCLCSYADNRERAGVGGFWFNDDCPYHGNKK